MADWDNIRETPFGECIGATILDITAVDTEDFLAGAPSHVYFHLSNGETIFATLGTEDNPGPAGMLGTEDEDADA